MHWCRAVRRVPRADSLRAMLSDQKHAGERRPADLSVRWFGRSHLFAAAASSHGSIATRLSPRRVPREVETPLARNAWVLAPTGMASIDVAISVAVGAPRYRAICSKGGSRRSERRDEPLRALSLLARSCDRFRECPVELGRTFEHQVVAGACDSAVRDPEPRERLLVLGS